MVDSFVGGLQIVADVASVRMPTQAASATTLYVVSTYVFLS